MQVNRPAEKRVAVHRQRTLLFTLCQFPSNRMKCPDRSRRPPASGLSMWIPFLIKAWMNESNPKQIP